MDSKRINQLAIGIPGPNSRLPYMRHCIYEAESFFVLPSFFLLFPLIFFFSSFSLSSDSDSIVDRRYDKTTCNVIIKLGAGGITVRNWKREREDLSKVERLKKNEKKEGYGYI